MNPSQKDDDGQEWEPWNAEHLTDEQRAKIQTVPWWAIRDGYSRLALVWAEVDKDAILADHRDAQQLREFMEWLTDQQVVHWTLTEETANDPRKAVEALLQTYLNEINDPTISEVARKAAESDVLRERVRVLEEALSKQQDALMVLKAWIKSSKEDTATINYEGIASLVNEAYESARALRSSAATTEGGERA